jgi:hypothetical protein
MLAFDELKQPLDRALDCARGIGERCIALLNRNDCRDEIRDLRRDLPFRNKQALAAFSGNDPLKAELVLK